MNHAIYVDGRVRVMRRMCDTCIFRSGNLMRLEPGRVDGMVRDAVARDSTIVCHDTLTHPLHAACRGFFDRHKTQPLQVAERLRLVRWVEPNGKDGAMDEAFAGVVWRRARGVYLACVNHGTLSGGDEDDDYDAFPTESQARKWVEAQITNYPLEALRWSRERPTMSHLRATMRDEKATG